MAIKFDLSSIPSDATVVSASLKLYNDGSYYQDAGTYNAHCITSPWSESSASWTSGWNSSGGDFNSQILDSHSFSGSTGSWFEFDVKSAVQDFISGTVENYGFMIDTPGGDDAGGASMEQETYFKSKETSNASQRPVLEVVYDATNSVFNIQKNTVSGLTAFLLNKSVIQIACTTNKNADISLINIQGKEMFIQENVILKKGTNNLDMNEAIGKGIYFLKVKAAQNVNVFKLVVR